MANENGVAMHAETDRDERRSATQTARLVLGILLLCAAVGVVVDNRRSTRVGYVFGDVSAPLVLVLVVAGFAGALIGWLLLHRLRHDH